MKFFKKTIFSIIMCIFIIGLPITTYAGSVSGSWKSDSNGWWYDKGDGTYLKNTWQSINGKYYYFLEDGYMDYSEYRDGYWLNADGTLNKNYSNGIWKKDTKGWWYEDNGWYPVDQTLWIDGTEWYFDTNGYLYTEYDNSNGDFWTKYNPIYLTNSRL